jgi:uncharacterized damage-inducible protein DinB
MKAAPSEIEIFLKALSDTPRRIAQAASGMDEAHLTYTPDNKSWSVNDILAHIRSCADVWGDSMEAMLTEENPTLPDIHPRIWVKQTSYPHLSFNESFQAFMTQRKKLLTRLKKLSLEDWSRPATIGKRSHSVFTQVRRMAKHEQEHLEQIEILLQDKR